MKGCKSIDRVYNPLAAATTLGNTFVNACAGYVRRVTHDEIADAIG
jgi:hypothetical protein